MKYIYIFTLKIIYVLSAASGYAVEMHRYVHHRRMLNICSSSILRWNIFASPLPRKARSGRGRSSAVSEFFLILLGGKPGPIC